MASCWIYLRTRSLPSSWGYQVIQISSHVYLVFHHLVDHKPPLIHLGSDSCLKFIHHSLSLPFTPPVDYSHSSNFSLQLYDCGIFNHLVWIEESSHSSLLDFSQGIFHSSDHLGLNPPSYSFQVLRHIYLLPFVILSLHRQETCLWLSTLRQRE